MQKPGFKNYSPSAAEAEVIGLKILAFLASDDDRLAGFLRMTGTDPRDLRASAAEPAFLSGVIHYLVQNESLLTEFAGAYELDPALPLAAHAVLERSLQDK